MAGFFKRKVAECLWCEAVDVRDKARIGVVLDVATLDKVLHGIEWTILSLLKFYDVSLEKIHLQIYTHMHAYS